MNNSAPKSQSNRKRKKQQHARRRHSSRESYNSRAIAAQAIFAILESGKSLQEVLPDSLETLKDQDKPWLHEMLYGVLRNLPTLQHWLRQNLTTQIKPQSRIVEHLLFLGLYQLHFSRVAAHAAVSETVAACEVLKHKHMKGLVNGVLRSFQRQDETARNIEDERTRLNLPKWYYKKLQEFYPKQYQEIAHQQGQKPPIWLRVNQRNTSISEYLEKLNEANIAFSQSENVNTALKLTKSQSIEQLPGYEDGLFSVQDKAAQHAAIYLEAQPGDTVLDACAAPGGKYLHILETQPKLARCLALEIDEQRLQSVKTNALRLKINDIELVAGDAANSATWNKNQQLFDKILLDAPCSATGIIRRHPDILWLRKRQDIENLVNLQASILDEIWQQLKPGGILLYATCSILPEENWLQIRRFLKTTDDAEIIPLVSETKELPGRQILPGESGMDGFYYAKLRKRKTGTL